MVQLPLHLIFIAGGVQAEVLVAESKDHVSDIQEAALGHRPAARHRFSILVARATSSETAERSVGVHGPDGDARAKFVGLYRTMVLISVHDERPTVASCFVLVGQSRDIEWQVVAHETATCHDDVPEWTIYKLVAAH